MAIDIGPKIGIDGEAQYRRELNQIIQGQKTLEAESKAVSAAMQDETDAEKKAAAQKDVLNRQIANQREKLAKLEEGLTASARKYGEADTRTQKWQQAVYNATGDLANMEHKLRTSDNQVEEITQDMGKAEQATSGWGDVLKGTLAADAIKAGLSFIKEAVSGIAEKTIEASKAGAAYADEFLTLATNTGVATDTLQELAYMEGIADVSTNDVAGAIQKLKKTMATAESQNQSYAKKMAKAAQETDAQKRAQKEANIALGDTAAAYKELGIEIKDANGQFRKGEDAFFDMIEALGKVEDETRRDQLAMTLMGKSATDLNPIITAGADALAKMRKEAHDTGYVLSGSALSALGKQQDAMDRLDKKTEALSNRYASKLAPSVERAYSLMGEALDNPRVKRGLDVVAEGIGGIISGAAELASKALPELFSVFTLGDERLKYLTDDQLALVESVDESRQAHEELISSYKANATEIVGETERIQGLWEELQTLVGENGKVRKADEERVNYINSELSKALGTQMQLEDGILQGYKDQQKEIDSLIKKREAEALIAAGAEQFAKAEKERQAALERSGKLAQQVDKAMQDLKKAQTDYANAVDYANKMSEGVWSDDRALRYINEYVGKVKDAENAYKLLADEYEDARKEAAGYYADVAKWESAQTAAANGNYREVVRLLADEFGVTLDYYNRKKQLSEQEKKDLKAKVSDLELTIAEYRRNLSAGLAGFSEAGLAELEAYIRKAQDILDGKAVGEAYLDGLTKGLKNSKKQQQVAEAAAAVAYSVTRQTKNVLQIASPSKVSDWMGQMWGEGLVRGVLKERQKVEDASRLVAGAFVGPAAATVQVSSYTGGTTLAPMRYSGGASAGSSIRIGTIPISITTPGQVDARALAAEISVQLTDTLRRAQRGGRT